MKNGKYVVTISAGHGGNSIGGVYYPFIEKEINLDVALAAQMVLEQHGVLVNMIRTDNDTTVDLETRANMSDAANSDLYIAIHHDMAKGDGASIFYSVALGLSKEAGEAISQEISNIGQNIRYLGYKKDANGKDYYAEVRMPNAPSVLVECGFMDNPVDSQIFDTLPERMLFGVAIGKGVLKALKIKFVEDIPMKKLIVYYTEADIGPALLAKRKEHCPICSQEDLDINKERADFTIYIGGPFREGPGVLCLTGANAEKTQEAVINHYYPKGAK